MAMKRLRWIMTLCIMVFTGLSLAAPLINPTSLEAVCSTEHGTRLVVVGDSDGDPATLMTEDDCPLCSGFFTPTLLGDRHFELPSPLALALEPRQEAFLIALAQPPLPSRGPPTPV